MVWFPLLASASGIPLEAQSLVEGVPPWLTNSIVVCALVTLLILVLARRATKTMELVPNKAGQNIFEVVVEGLYSTVGDIVGPHMVARVFPLLATFFIFILTANWFGLLPGVGTIGFGEKSGFLSLQEMQMPLLRPATADLNLTLAMAALFMILWVYWTLTETGLVQFLKHEFMPKGGLTGFLAVVMVPIFLFVGLIEMVSIAFRPVSLSLRLFGNIFAGENLLHAMGAMGDALPPPLPFIVGVVLPLPFYFLELLVGLIQALVFTLLCAVYIQLSTSHDEEEHPH